MRIKSNVLVIGFLLGVVGCATNKPITNKDKILHAGTIIDIYSVKNTKSGQFTAFAASSISVDEKSSILNNAKFTGTCAKDVVKISKINNTSVNLIAGYGDEQGNSKSCSSKDSIATLLLTDNAKIPANLIIPDLPYKEVDYNTSGYKFGIDKIMTTGNHYIFDFTNDARGYPNIVGVRNGKIVILNQSSVSPDDTSIIKVDTDLTTLKLIMNEKEETISILPLKH